VNLVITRNLRGLSRSRVLGGALFRNSFAELALNLATSAGLSRFKLLAAA